MTTEPRTVWEYRTTSTLDITADEQLDWYMLEWSNGLERLLQLQKILIDNGRLSQRRVLSREEARQR